MAIITAKNITQNMHIARLSWLSAFMRNRLCMVLYTLGAEDVKMQWQIENDVLDFA